VFDHEIVGALRAELDYEVVKTAPDKSILKINLKTGRPHQIRAQLAALGHPIVGDVKYGARAALPDRSLALCATAIEFKLATVDEIKKLEIVVPKEWSNI